MTRLERLYRRLESWKHERAVNGPLAESAPHIIALLESEIEAERRKELLG